MWEREIGIFPYKGDYLVSDDMTPTQRHQVFDELEKVKKEFAALLYFQRDREGRIP